MTLGLLNPHISPSSLPLPLYQLSTLYDNQYHQLKDKLVTYKGGSLTELEFNTKSSLRRDHKEKMESSTPNKQNDEDNLLINPPQGGGIRQDVRGLSSSSRLRLSRKLAKVDFPGFKGRILSTTLTYPLGKHPADSKTWKDQLDTFLSVSRESLVKHLESGD
jgi:hypothetical protein